VSPSFDNSADLSIGRNGKNFWSFVDRRGGPDTCWPWTGYRDARGYGRARRGEDKRTAQRWAYIFTTGAQLRRDEFVCHHCDNPPCCNPAHLYVGSHDDNMRDRNERERTCFGTRNGRARLNDVAVRVIRFMAKRGLATPEQLAEAHGVSRAAIRFVVSRNTWRHVA